MHGLFVESFINSAMHDDRKIEIFIESYTIIQLDDKSYYYIWLKPLFGYNHLLGKNLTESLKIPPWQSTLCSENNIDSCQR